MTPRVLCNCTIDPLGDGKWMATVTGLAPHDVRRIYTINAASDDLAARQALERFEDDMGDHIVM